MSNLSPPPYRDKDFTGQAWQKWFAYLYQAVTDNKTSATTANTTAQSALANQSTTARSLASLTTVIDVASSVAPIAGQVLVANDDVSATWQTPTSASSVSSLIAVSLRM